MPDNQKAETTELSSPARAQPVKTENSKLVFWRILSSILLLAVLALGTLLYLYRSGAMDLLPDAPSPSEEPVVTYTVSCFTPQGETLSVSGAQGQTVQLPRAPEIDGYSFIGWADQDGLIAEDGTVMLEDDVSFNAVYAIAFRDESAGGSHEPYMSIGDDQMFHPGETVSRAEAAELLYSILDTSLVGSGSFSDVPETADCYTAAATLKDLGVIEGSRFHPDDPISLRELFEILVHFYSPSTSAYSFSMIPESDSSYKAFCLAMDRGWIRDTSVSPDSDLTRAEAAHIFNLLCGRSPFSGEDYFLVGTILDVSFDDPFFGDIAEAAIPHEAQPSSEGEHWTESSALHLYDEGMFFIGTALHCADSRGSAVVNDSYGNFDFGSDGVITTGMPELDELVQQTLQELVDPSTMDTERMLRVIYNYVTYHNSYLRIHYYEVGDTSWVNDEAYHMLTEHKGNCYNFSSEFYVLVRAVGIDAVIYSGQVDPIPVPHAWVEIETDGESFIYDTELEFTQVTIAHSNSSFFKMPYWKAAGWHYYRGHEIEDAIAAKNDGNK